jgi:hypothetical protein
MYNVHWTAKYVRRSGTHSRAICQDGQKKTTNEVSQVFGVPAEYFSQNLLIAKQEFHPFGLTV